MNTLMKMPARGVARRWNDDLDQLFEGFFRPLRWVEEGAGEGLAPRLDVKERANEFVIEAEMPGVQKDGIEITLEDGVLTLSAETESRKEQKEGEQVVRCERRYGRYVRSLRLGKGIDEKNVRANYKDGVLEITLPKSEEVKPKKISVTIN